MLYVDSAAGPAPLFAAEQCVIDSSQQVVACFSSVDGLSRGSRRLFNNRGPTSSRPALGEFLNFTTTEVVECPAWYKLCYGLFYKTIRILPARETEWASEPPKRTKNPRKRPPTPGLLLRRQTSFREETVGPSCSISASPLFPRRGRGREHMITKREGKGVPRKRWHQPNNPCRQIDQDSAVEAWEPFFFVISQSQQNDKNKRQVVGPYSPADYIRSIVFRGVGNTAPALDSETSRPSVSSPLFSKRSDKDIKVPTCSRSGISTAALRASQT